MRDCGLTPDAILWQQGETDAWGSTSTAAYQAALGQVIHAFRNEGVTAPFFVALTSHITIGGEREDPGDAADVRAAQTVIVNGVDIFQGADTDTLDDTYRAHGTHFNSTGQDTHAELWFDVLARCSPVRVF